MTINACVLCGKNTVSCTAQLMDSQKWDRGTEAFTEYNVSINNVTIGLFI